MLRKYYLLFTIFSIGLCQYPFIHDKHKFPEVFVARDYAPPLQINLQHYFDGFNLSYSATPPALERVKTISVAGSKTRVLVCSPTAPEINGSRPTHIILQGNDLEVVLEDSKTNRYSVVSSEPRIDCFEVLEAPNDPSLFLFCYNSTSKQNNVYLISSIDFEVKKKVVIAENFNSPTLSIKRKCKGGQLVSGGKNAIHLFYLFSVSLVTKEWLIQEVMFEKEVQNLWTGNIYSSDSSPNNMLQNMLITDFVPFEDRLILYDEKDKVLINYYKKTIQFMESIYKLVYSDDGNFTRGVISMSGSIRESNLQEQILLNIDQEIYHFSIEKTGEIKFRNSYQPIQSLRIIDSLFLNDEVFIFANNGLQNRISIYNTNHVEFPVYFEADDDDAEDGARFFEDPYNQNQFFKVDPKGIVVFKRNPAILTIGHTLSQEVRDYQLIITSQNRFIKEYDLEYPSNQTLTVRFKVIHKKMNDIGVHVLRQNLGTTLIQHPERQIIDLYGIFDGPALNIDVQGITQANLKNYEILEPSINSSAAHTLVSFTPAGDIIILQELRGSGGSVITLCKGENFEGRQLMITSLPQFSLNSPVISMHAEHYPIILLVTENGDSTVRGTNGRNIFAVNLVRLLHNSAAALAIEVSLKENYCDQLHFSRDPEYPNKVYCFNSEEEKLSIYHFDKLNCQMVQESVLQGPFYFGDNFSIEQLRSIDTHESFPGILLLRYLGRLKLGFYSWTLKQLVATEYLGTSDYAILPNTLLDIDYVRRSVQVRDLEYVNSLNIEGRFNTESHALGIISRIHNLDLFECVPVHGSAYAPANSHNFYIRAKCPQSPNNQRVLVYDFQNEAQDGLRAVFEIPQSENVTIQVFSGGGLLDSDKKSFDLLAVSSGEKIYYYAVYDSPHVVFDTVRNLIHLKETLTVFSIQFEAHSKFSDPTNKKQAELILTVAKLQNSIKKKAVNHTEIVPFSSHSNDQGADVTCFYFNPYDLWEGSVLEVDHSFVISPEKKNDLVNHQEFMWQLDQRYKIFNRLFERHAFPSPGTWSFKPTTSHIYYFDNEKVVIASKKDPEKFQKILAYNSKTEAQAMQNVKLCKLEGCFVGVGTQNDITYYAKFFGISDDYQLLHFGDIQYDRAPSAFALSDDNLFFGVFDYDHHRFLNETFLSIFHIKNPSRNWTILFESLPFIAQDESSIGFHGIDVALQSPGVYVVFISTNATGFMTCEIKLLESKTISFLQCEEYNFNIVRSDLVFDEVPSWTEITVLSQMQLNSNPIDNSKNLIVYTILIAGTNTPLYIVDVTPGKGFGILQGFVNYHPLGSQLQIASNSHYIITYVTYKKNLASEFENYVYFYKRAGNESIKINKNDDWTLEEAVMRIRVDKQSSYPRSLIEIDPLNNTLYILDLHNSRMTLSEIIENATLCIHWNVEIASGIPYDLVIVARNDLGSQGFAWNFNSDHHLKEHSVRHGNRYLIMFGILLLVLCLIFSVASFIRKLRTSTRNRLSSAADSMAEIPEIRSSYRPLGEL